MARNDGINAIGRERKPDGDIQPEILRLEGIAINIYEAGFANTISPGSQV